jgi:chemotaxis protein methyltransferase CheR
MNGMYSLQELVLSKYGLVARDSWKKEIESAVQGLANERNLADQELIELALRDKCVLQEIAGRLTVEESFFFRHGEHHHAFIDYIEKRLRSPETGPIIIWSAGCSEGQEPFSIAMALKEQFNDFDCARISIIATDLCAASIENAKHGIYPEWSFRGVDEARRRLFFKRLGPDQFEIRKDIREMVDFRCLSIQEHGWQFTTSSVDCVFFRNVAIYLSSSAQLEICHMFNRIMHRQGLLFLAPSDQRPLSNTFTCLNKNSTSILVPIDKSCPVYSLSGGRMSSSIPKPLRRFSSTMPRPNSKHPRVGFNPDRVLSHGMATPGLCSPAVTEHARLALSLADSGDFTKAISESNTLIEQQPHNKLGYLIRGQVHLASDNFNKAISDFRRAAFIDPDDTVVRFWYAYGLQKCGSVRRSLMQINGLLSELSPLRHHTLLEDGQTTVGELIVAAKQIKERLV